MEELNLCIGITPKDAQEEMRLVKDIVNMNLSVNGGTCIKDPDGKDRYILVGTIEELKGLMMKYWGYYDFSEICIWNDRMRNLLDVWNKSPRPNMDLWKCIV